MILLDLRNAAWVQISHGDATVVATFKTPTGFLDASSTKAKSGCWSMLKGGLTVNTSALAQLYFQVHLWHHDQGSFDPHSISFI